MGDVPMPHATERVSAERYTYIGAGLIVLAFGGPALATMFGLGNAFSVGQDLARTLGSLAFLALIAWLVTRKRSDLAKAKARTVVGVLLCITVGNNIANSAKEVKVAKQFVRDAIAFQTKHASKFEDLGARFHKVTVAQYLTPAGLTSPQNILAGQAALERYRLLLAERNLLLQTYLAEYTAFVNTLPPGETRRGAESAIGPSKQATEDLYKLLDKTQSAQADAMGSIFTWAHANAGKLRLRGEQLLFQTQQQQSELTALAAKLQTAENAVNAAVGKANGDIARAAAKREQSMKEAETFLSR
jgi:hypothetical protein